MVLQSYRILADLMVVIHLFFVVLAVVGVLLAMLWRWLIWMHFPAVLWSVWIEFSGAIFPLTPLENWLRIKGGQAGYQAGFVKKLYYARALSHRYSPQHAVSAESPRHPDQCGDLWACHPKTKKENPSAVSPN